MRKRMTNLGGLTLVSILLAAPAEPRILSVSPIDGLPGQIIDAPNEALDNSIASSTHMLGFNERQNVLLIQDLKVDGGIITNGTRVNSHMILFNLPDYSPDNTDGDDAPSEWFSGALSDNEWIFSGPVLGVMSDTDGILEAASTQILGARATTYPSGDLFLRGFEDNDFYDGVGTTRLRVRMSVWQPGDWIRVITGAQPIAHNASPGLSVQTAQQPDSQP